MFHVDSSGAEQKKVHVHLQGMVSAGKIRRRLGAKKLIFLLSSKIGSKKHQFKCDAAKNRQKKKEVHDFVIKCYPPVCCYA